MICQTPIGYVIDATATKSSFIYSANLVIGLSCVALILDDSVPIVYAAMILQGIGNSIGFPGIYR